MTRDTLVLLPISYEGWDEAGGDYGDIQLYKVEFTEDFGPWKKGEKEEYLVILQLKGAVESPSKKINVKLVPTE